ncbi:MAG: hypothetical protein V4569_02020 [Pseudomonadota bacterium]
MTVNVRLLTVKLAVTLVAPATVTLHTATPLQAPLQPAKSQPSLGAALNVVLVPSAKGWLQSALQASPIGEEFTVPDPTNATAKACVTGVKVAVTAVSPAIVSAQGPVPLHAPLQPANVQPADGTAFSTRLVPAANGPPHVVPQAMPAGTESMVPEPTTATTTSWLMAEKLAVTIAAALNVSVQGAVPEHLPPPQPSNRIPVPAAAVIVTGLP